MMPIKVIQKWNATGRMLLVYDSNVLCMYIVGLLNLHYRYI